MKEYLTKMSVEDQWDIMKLAIAKGDPSLVYGMLKDGYLLSCRLLEALYRSFGTHAVISAVDAYQYDISENNACMVFLKENLEPSALIAVVERNAKKIELQEQKEREDLEKHIQAVFSNLESTCSDRKDFYRKIRSSQDVGVFDLFELAFETYGKDQVFNELKELGLISTNCDGDVFYDVEILLMFGIDYLYEKGHIVEATAVLCGWSGMFVDDAAIWIRDVAEAGGMEYIVKSKTVLLYDLFADEQMRQKAKQFGTAGYLAVYRYAKDHFTLEDWYEWYKIDQKAAMDRYHKCKVPRSWLIQNGYIKQAIFYKK